VLAGEDVVITWERRGRILGDLVDNTGSVPLSEDSEAYELEILDFEEAVLRTVTGLTSKSYTYTAADQAADGYPVFVRLYQISAQVGRGLPGTATLEGALTLMVFGEEQTEGAGGASNRAFEGDRVIALQYTAPATGKLQFVELYLGDGSGDIRAGVYADIGGEPAALLAETASQTVSSPRAWVRFDLPAPLLVSGGQSLWLCGHASGSIHSISETTNNTGRRYVEQPFASGLPDPFGAGSGFNNTRGLRGSVEVKV